MGEARERSIDIERYSRAFLAFDVLAPFVHLIFLEYDVSVLQGLNLPRHVLLKMKEHHVLAPSGPAPPKIHRSQCNRSRVLQILTCCGTGLVHSSIHTHVFARRKRSVSIFPARRRVTCRTNSLLARSTRSRFLIGQSFRGSDYFRRCSGHLRDLIPLSLMVHCSAFVPTHVLMNWSILLRVWRFRRVFSSGYASRNCSPFLPCRSGDALPSFRRVLSDLHRFWFVSFWSGNFAPITPRFVAKQRSLRCAGPVMCTAAALRRQTRRETKR